MPPSSRARWARGIVPALLASLALLLGGCVYLRLLEVKRQLGDFERFFTLDTSDGIRIGCLTPVLLTGDFRWFGITPESVRSLGQAEQWRVRWIKQVPEGRKESVVRDVEIELGFTDDRLTRIHIPEGYFALIPKEFLVGLLRGLGAADIDKARRDAAVRLAGGGTLPIAAVTLEALTDLLGEPSTRVREGPRTSLRYRYEPTPAGARNGRFDLTFVFDTASGKLVFLQNRTPVGQISFNFEPAGPADGAVKA